jgi:hypothetical protein
MTAVHEARALRALDVSGALPLLAGTPWRGIMILATGFAIVVGLVRVGVLPAAVLAVAAVATVHGGLLATAVAWSTPSPPAHERLAPTFVLAGALLIAATVTAVHPLGALAYVAPPVAMALLLDPRRAVFPSRGLLVTAALFGIGVGAHLLLAASSTLGHRPHVPQSAAAIGALGYVLSAECFFRGALFDRLQRRWSFTAAATASTAAGVLRYLIDPLLPKTPDAVIGAVFYLGLLGVFNCWLLWRSGSVLPGIVSSLLFFTAYRLLTTG